MRLLRTSIAGLLLAVLLPAQAAVNGSDKSQRLVSEGLALIPQGEYKAASEKFEAARKESPEASSPLSAFSYMLLALAYGSATPQAKNQREQAGAWARKALAIAADDPVANEVLRALNDETEKPGHIATAAANVLFKEGETFFHQGQYEAARLKYRAAYKEDPRFAKAMIMEGDTYFMEKNWSGAELMFKMAAELDPLDSQAWRFLSDARVRLGDGQGAMAATVHAIAAMPSEAGNWERLKAMQAAAGKPLARLGFERKAWVQRDPAKGGQKINIEPGSQAGVDGAIWLAYAMALAAGPKDGKAQSPFQGELQAWSTALQVASELEAKGEPSLQSAALLTLKKLHTAGQLDAAIFLLMYKESYRPDFETWKQAHPTALRDFIDTWRLMP
ncbi:tetratricopeptide repeat protein [Pseudoduganella violaceinigra]|uniref:tetratricopeptide repeat protein n=1 Tax=Pseudoduganella violaceinigra TaxID=246602 RepID=UPI000A019F32|nr:tetratricopeptide repeat protein [Pseudoduganella violaceinigra]